MYQKGFAPIIALVVLLVVVGGGYVLWSGSNEESEDIVEGTSDDSTREQEAEARTLRDLVEAGEEVMCTFTSSDANVHNAGTVYVSGENMRGDFVSETDMGTFESHMIEMDGYVYTWSSALPQGFKMPIDTTDLSTADTSSDSSGEAEFDYNASYAYDCDSWERDDSKFSIPTDIQFVSPSELFSL